MHRWYQIHLCTGVNTMWYISRQNTCCSPYNMQIPIPPWLFSWMSRRNLRWSATKKQKTRPITKDDYLKYKYVLPSSKTVEYKHQQAAQEERGAAVALINKTAHHNVTLHFDTISQNHIDGEWPSLIFNLSDGKRFRLRPILFTYEDRDNIVRLIVETYERLALAATIFSGINTSPDDLWKKTNCLMTDAIN